MTKTAKMKCADCGKEPANLRKRGDGEIALPMKWQRKEDGRVVCSQCRHDDPTINWTFGADRPVDSGFDLVVQQFRLAHQFRNKLCEVELKRRAAVDKAIRDHNPELADLEQSIVKDEEELNGIISKIKQRNSQDRSRNQPDKSEKERLSAIRAKLKDQRKRRKELRDQFFKSEERTTVLKNLEVEFADLKNAVYNETTLYWPSKCLIMQAANSMSKGAPPKYIRWQLGRKLADDDKTTDFPVDGHIAVQLQGGQSISETFKHSGMFYITKTGEKRRGGERAIAHFRIGTKDGAPIFVKVPICVDRMPPDNAKVKWAHLICEVSGSTEHWKLMLAVQWPDANKKPDCANSGAVGINLGWPKVDGGIRVCTWVGSDGQSGELILPKHQIDALDYFDRLRSIQDKMFNDARDKLIAWLEKAKMEARFVPEWLVKGADSLHLWHSARRLCRLMDYWRDHRFAGDEDVFLPLYGHRVMRDGKPHYEGFRLQWRHVNDMEEGRRRRLNAQRKHLYLNFAAMLRRKYKTLCVDSSDYAEMGKKPIVGVEDKQSQHLRRMSRLASVGMLRMFLKQSMANIVEVDSKHITQTCCKCKRIMDVDASGERMISCPHCGDVKDQDLNAAMNALMIGSSGESPKPASRGSEDAA